MKKFRLLIFLPFLFLFFGNTLFGQGNTGVPELNGHRFINNRLVIDPFIKSAFRQNMGVGLSQKINLPLIEIGDSIYVGSTGTLMYANLNFQFDGRLKEGVSYHLRVGGSARVGVEPSTFYTNGLNTITGISNAWKIRLFQNDKHMLSTMLGINTYSASVTNLSVFLNDIIGGNPNPNITEKIYILEGSASIHYAYAISNVIGLQAMGQLTYGDLFEAEKSGANAYVVGAVDINLYPKTRVPLGLSMAYGYTSIPDYTAAKSNIAPVTNIKLAHTKADSFIISVDATTFTTSYLVGYFARRTNAETRIISYSLNVLIYFN